MIVTGPDFDVAAVAAGEPVQLGDELLGSLKENRARVLDALTSGRRVYGVNTGMGRLAGVALDARQQAVHQRNLLIGRAVGGPPWLSPAEVRWLLAVRLRDLLRLDTGVSPELARFLADRLNDGFVPAVPRGGLGSAGEIIPLSHAFQTFLGIGYVLEDGVEVPAAEALAQRGVTPYVLGPKEGASLIQGSPLAVAYASMSVPDLRRVVELSTLTAAIAVDVLGAPHAVYRPETADPHLRAILVELNMVIEGASPRPDIVQAPVSVRVAPRALAHLSRVVDDLVSTIALWSTSPVDSPLFVAGDFVPGTGYHAVDIGLRMDAATAAVIHIGEICVQRMHRLLDERFTGLDPQLTRDPGPQAGLTPLHKRAVGELHTLRRLGTPATLGSVDTSAGQEDVQAFAWAAGDQLRTALNHLWTITACELIAGAQARWLAAGDGAPALRPTYEWIHSIVPPIEEDRPLGPELQRLTQSLVDGGRVPPMTRSGSGARIC